MSRSKSPHTIVKTVKISPELDSKLKLVAANLQMSEADVLRFSINLIFNSGHSQKDV